MKLKHKIAGTLLLPLAAATMANTAHAELSVGGFVAGQFSMVDADKIDHDSDNTTARVEQSDFTGTAATSRLSIKQTDLGPSDATVLIEGDFWGGRNANRTSYSGNLRLRHAVVMVDGWKVGQTWSSAANLNGILPTIDFVGLTAGSAHANRYPMIARTMNMGSSKFSFGVEDWGSGEAGKDGPSIPDLAAGFSTKAGGLSIFAGAALVNDNDKDNKNTTYAHLTASAKMMVSDGMNLVASFTSTGNDEASNNKDESWTAASAGLGMNLGGGLSANAMAEVKSYGASGAEDQTTLFVNTFYKMPSGLQLGAELQSVTDLGGFDGAETTNINFQGKYAF